MSQPPPSAEELRAALRLARDALNLLYARDTIEAIRQSEAIRAVDHALESLLS